MSRRCCCLPGCTICEDTFNRPDSSIILPFIDHTGNWSISTNRLKESGNSNAIAYCPTPHFYETPSGWVYATAKNLQLNARPAVFLNYTPGASAPTEYVKVYCNSGNKAAVELSAGGVEDVWTEADWTPGGDLRLFICRSLRGVYGGIVNQTWLQWLCIDSSVNSTRQFAGVANMGNTPVWFDDFYYEQHWQTNRICPRCECECDSYCLPSQLLLTLQSSNPNRDGTEWSLEIDTASYPNFEWVGTEALWECYMGTGTGTGTGGSDTTFRFKCLGPNSFSLGSDEFQSQCTSTDWPGNIGEDAVGDIYSCNPLDIRFGPYSCTFSPPAPPDCEETLILTEP